MRTLLVLLLIAAFAERSIADDTAKPRAACPYDGKKMTLTGVLVCRETFGPVTELNKDQKIVFADDRYSITGTSLRVEVVPAVDVFFPDELLRKQARELNGQRVEIACEGRRLVVVPESFGDLDSGVELAVGKGKSLWVPDTDNVRMPATRVILVAASMKLVGPRRKEIMGEPVSNIVFGDGKYPVHTITRLPRAAEVTTLRIVRDSSDDYKDLKPLTVINFPALLDGMTPIASNDEDYRLSAKSPWYEVSFETLDGAFRLRLYLGGLAALTAPDGRLGYAKFDHPK